MAKLTTGPFELNIYRRINKAGFIRACEWNIKRCDEAMKIQMQVDPNFTLRINRINAYKSVYQGYMTLAQEGIFPKGFEIVEY